SDRGAFETGDAAFDASVLVLCGHKTARLAQLFDAPTRVRFRDLVATGALIAGGAICLGPDAARALGPGGLGDALARIFALAQRLPPPPPPPPDAAPP